MNHDFYKKLTKIFDRGQSRSVLLTGNIHDLYFNGEKYVQLTEFLSKRAAKKPTSDSRGVIVVTYEVNQPIQILGEEEEFTKIWNVFKGVKDEKDKNYLPTRLRQSQDSIPLAIELLRQFTVCSRMMKMKWNLLIIVEAADTIFPVLPYGQLQPADRRNIAICHDWFSDPEFMSGHDSVVFLTESRSQINEHVGKLRQVLEVSIPIPDKVTRWDFIKYHKDSTTADKLAEPTAALSLMAINQLLLEEEITPELVNEKVAEYIKSQLGEDTVEFVRPTHKLADLRGFSQIKKFIEEDLIPRIKGDANVAISGAAIGGPIGGGKTHIMLALASELGIPVLILKNLRSQWYGGTDIMIERLYRTAVALDKAAIFVDEADTQFGGVGADVHETEKRLTGKIQAMMSDPLLKGKLIWLLMTARINLLSPDIRRPGRAGDLIIPILDPEGSDRNDFINWTFESVMKNVVINTACADNATKFNAIHEATKGYSAASFAALRSEIKAKKCTTLEEAIAIADDIIPSDIEETRRYQVLQALLNCTRKSLIPKTYTSDPKKTIAEYRSEWKKEIEQLEAKGIK